MKYKTTVICSTYNDVEFLSIVLDSLIYQSTGDFELIVADDGSTSETKKAVHSFQKVAGFNVKHIWHEDKGWRKAKIHNEAIRAASGDLLIFIDGDCILGENFVLDHKKVYESERENYVLMCRRVELGERITKLVSLKNYRRLLINSSLNYFSSIFTGDTHGGLRKFSVHNTNLRKILKADGVKDLIGANFSLPKNLMLEINGFNEYTDSICGSEDGDIFVRLRNIGTKLIGKKYYAPMFHKFHRRGSRTVSDNYYKEILKDNNYKYAKHGLVRNG